MTNLTRRQSIQLSLGALGPLALPNLLKLRAAPPDAASRDTAVIFVQLGGGASQFETYDPKPDAPNEIRGPFKSIPTSLPGVRFCELFPKQAALMNDAAVVRSVQHGEASHIALHMVETGYFLRNSGNALRGEMPSVGSVVARVRTKAGQIIPAFVSLPRPQAYSGPHYVGARFQYFPVDANPNDDDFKVNNLSLPGVLTQESLDDRQTLLRSFDDARRVADLDRQGEAMDQFRRQALDLVSGDRARIAFDIQREPGSLRDRYGRTAFGQRMLLARRLVEAGVPFVSVRTFDWDDHVNLPARIAPRAPMFDAGVSALIDDLKQRGMNRDVLVVAMGEFGRTPKMNPDSGRDHWPGVMSVLMAGGQYKMGQVIGSSNRHGGAAASSPYRPQNVLGMVYRHLGIDPGMTFPDFTGRPRHLLEEREPIAELM